MCRVREKIADFAGWSGGVFDGLHDMLDDNAYCCCLSTVVSDWARQRGRSEATV